MSKIANRNSWKTTLPLPAKREKFIIKRTFTTEEFNRLAKGLIPEAMEDKWFIFMEDGTLFFHRSWTGICVYQVHFDNQHRIDEIWVNRDREQYSEVDIEYDGKLLSFLIDNLLLGKNTPFPVPSNLPNKLPQGVYQHHVSGTGFHETQAQIKETLINKIMRVFKKKI